MNKKIILSSLLSSLFYTGCMQKVTPIVTPIEQQSETTIIEEDRPTGFIKDTTTYVAQTKYREMQTVQGGSITLGEHERGFEFPQYKGKIVLLELFGKNCHFCFENMPTINKIIDNYPNKVSVIGIQSAPPMAEGEAQQLIQEHNMNYPIVDQDEAKSILIYLRDIYGWRGVLPYILLIKDGQIEQVLKGSDHPFEEIAKGIEDIK